MEGHEYADMEANTSIIGDDNMMHLANGKRHFPEYQIYPNYRTCPLCSRSMPNQSELKKHLKDHEKLVYQCHKCPGVFLNITGIQRHLPHCVGNRMKPSQTSESDLKNSCDSDPVLDVEEKDSFAPGAETRRAVSERLGETGPQKRTKVAAFAKPGEHDSSPPRRDRSDRNSGIDGEKRKTKDDDSASYIEISLTPSSNAVTYSSLMMAVNKKQLLRSMRANHRYTCPVCGKKLATSTGVLNHMTHHADLSPALNRYTQFQYDGDDIQPSSDLIVDEKEKEPVAFYPCPEIDSPLATPERKGGTKPPKRTQVFHFAKAYRNSSFLNTHIRRNRSDNHNTSVPIIPGNGPERVDGRLEGSASRVETVLGSSKNTVTYSSLITSTNKQQLLRSLRDGDHFFCPVCNKKSSTSTGIFNHMTHHGDLSPVLERYTQFQYDSHSIADEHEKESFTYVSGAAETGGAVSDHAYGARPPKRTKVARSAKLREGGDSSSPSQDVVKRHRDNDNGAGIQGYSAMEPMEDPLDGCTSHFETPSRNVVTYSCLMASVNKQELLRSLRDGNHYLCPVCDKKFSTSTGVFNHMTHHGDLSPVLDRYTHFKYDRGVQCDSDVIMDEEENDSFAYDSDIVVSAGAALQCSGERSRSRRRTGADPFAKPCENGALFYGEGGNHGGDTSVIQEYDRGSVGEKMGVGPETPATPSGDAVTYSWLMSSVDRQQLLRSLRVSRHYICPVCDKKLSTSTGVFNHMTHHSDLSPVLNRYTQYHYDGDTEWEIDQRKTNSLVVKKKRSDGFRSNSSRAKKTKETMRSRDERPNGSVRRRDDDDVSLVPKREGIFTNHQHQLCTSPGTIADRSLKISRRHPHVCPFCGRVFTKPYGINRHYLARHNLKVHGCKSIAHDDGGDVTTKVPEASEAFCSSSDVRAEEDCFKDTLSELECNINALLGCMVKDVAVLQEFGWPTRDVEELLTDILFQCGHMAFPDHRVSKSQLLRRKANILLKVCIKRQSLLTHGWGKKTVDEVLKEMLHGSPKKTHK